MSDSLSVLVVDDEPNILRSCSRVLERAGHRVQASSSGRLALELFDRENFDLIVTDVMMPDIGGLEFIQQIKERAPAATIVVITGYGTVDTATEALRRGASGFLTKPFTPGELRAAVLEAFQKGRAAEEAIRSKAFEPLTEHIAQARAGGALSDVLGLLAQSTRRATAADAAILVDERDQAPVLLAADLNPDLDPPVATSDFLRAILSVAAAGAQSWKEADGDDLDQRLVGIFQNFGIRASLICPIERPEGPTAALAVLRRADQRPFSEGDLSFLRIQAHQAEAFLERERLHDELNSTYLSVTVSLANALEARDAYTGGHCERMATLGAQLAEFLSLPQVDIEAVRLGGVLHDVGKIGVPDAILLKAGPLTPDERVVIEQHTEIGFQIVEPIKGLATVLPIIRHHHERFDGRGYPTGLRGPDIPIGARILGVCDAYEAMNSTRPYRPALPPDEIRRRLTQGSGTQFDPEILSVFFRMLR